MGFKRRRRTAEKYIVIHNAFLPQSVRPLYALAKLGLTDDQLQVCATDGLLNPECTEADIRQLAVRFKPHKTRSQGAKPKQPSNREPSAKVAELINACANLVEETVTAATRRILKIARVEDHAGLFGQMEKQPTKIIRVTLTEAAARSHSAAETPAELHADRWIET